MINNQSIDLTELFKEISFLNIVHNLEVELTETDKSLILEIWEYFLDTEINFSGLSQDMLMSMIIKHIENNKEEIEKELRSDDEHADC